MKKKALFIFGLLAIGIVGFSQAVKDRQVIPVAVNLNQVLRMTITNGGNIEFVFNSIDDYRLGLAGAAGIGANEDAANPFYVTDFTVASSTRWDLNYGAEEATFIGTDDPTNMLDLANVGYTLESTGGHDFETGLGQGTDPTAQLWSAPTVNGTEVAGLENYPALLIDDNGVAAANAGDGTDNAFQIVWRCGTAEVSAGIPNMVATSILDQDPSPAPDRYVANVIFELGIK
jgi:hypothetical protein